MCVSRYWRPIGDEFSAKNSQFQFLWKRISNTIFMASTNGTLDFIFDTSCDPNSLEGSRRFNIVNVSAKWETFSTNFEAIWARPSWLHSTGASNPWWGSYSALHLWNDMAKFAQFNRISDYTIYISDSLLFFWPEKYPCIWYHNSGELYSYTVVCDIYDPNSNAIVRNQTDIFILCDKGHEVAHGHRRRWDIVNNFPADVQFSLPALLNSVDFWSSRINSLKVKMWSLCNFVRTLTRSGMIKRRKMSGWERLSE